MDSWVLVLLKMVCLSLSMLHLVTSNASLNWYSFLCEEQSSTIGE